MGIVAGDLRYKIKVKEKTVTKNDYGEAVESWSIKFVLRAAKKYLSGGKGIDNSEIFTSGNIEFITYFRAITEDMQIEFNNENYIINSIEEIGFKEGLKIRVEKLNK